ncbi:1-aminocyclopropane-1-carboxylate deaminase/D-cysteine desulfhydrase [Myroides odoratimimus]|uniref:1-aminocyclopropane-1-carboxylate deaminase/D-cysteine desulfhydrase n=1 Tax=Myroides odoratimimus TaxID=76832 RepID=UPI0025783BCE|nr:pyridoxal-phosphate dependent enzyme [Myroides odoratimimus]MDM1454772.1 pyridoxal-phosphate dependent enzyme [Myroides odoratimimus]MDM1478505.1 pyridoxal-phosphate dependent enzyme [Myroides odoratimimus]MDM1490835.1 pyridoxal-phosphate dependent enzyme [Myroides odoratimimus]
MKNFRLITKLNENISVFRDDLYPFLGGGNKGRKMDIIAEDIFKKGANALVTTGGIQSNHCRAVAVFAAQYRMKCTLVLHGDQQKFHIESGNAKVMRDSGVNIIFAKNANEIGDVMDAEMKEYSKKGFNPYYIWGGGHTLEGGKAYISAIKELEKFCCKNNWYPDYIFHASGTGSTQSGILAGLDKYMQDTKVIGISVGRKTEQATKVVCEFYKELCNYYNIKFSNREVIVLDDYLCGGYGMYNDEIKELSQNSIKEFGFTLDTCYTAKAFYGMKDFIKRNDLENKKVLFWHTGGVFNYLAE